MDTHKVSYQDIHRFPDFAHAVFSHINCTNPPCVSDMGTTVFLYMCDRKLSLSDHPSSILQRAAVVKLSREVTQAPKRPWEEIKQAAFLTEVVLPFLSLPLNLFCHPSSKL